MLKLLKYLNWKEWLMVALTLTILCVHAVCNILIPFYLGDIVDSLEALSEPGAITSQIWNEILITVAKGFAVAVTIIVCVILVEFLSSIITTRLTARIRGVLYRHINEFSMAEINKFSIASLVTRSTNDLFQIQNVFSTMLGFGITAPLTAVFAIIMVVRLSPQLSVVNIVSVLVIACLATLIFSLVIPQFKKSQKVTDRINLLTRENLTGLRVIRAYSAEKSQEEKFERTNKVATKIDIFIGRVFSLMEPGVSTIMQGTQLAIVWLVFGLASSNAGLLGIISRFMQFSVQIIMGFMTISMLFMMVPRGIVSARRVNEVLSTKPSISDGQFEGAQRKRKSGSVKFEHVYFKYPGADEYVLEDISFEVKPGQTVAFIGSTGSGKSTLINLIPRFYDCTEGKITIDDVDIKDYKLSALHDRIGYVPQKGVLFSGTVKENIKYGASSATDEQVSHAIDVSESGFVYKFEDGLEHFISQGGKNVSGGQKQRLSIARAVIKKPEIFIFDDSFSALDYKTDKTLRRKLKSYTRSATSIIVAQRIGTIMGADNIIVLDNGRIVGMGKHEELLKKCKVYKEIALSQLTEEELSYEKKA